MTTPSNKMAPMVGAKDRDTAPTQITVPPKSGGADPQLRSDVDRNTENIGRLNVGIETIWDSVRAEIAENGKLDTALRADVAKLRAAIAAIELEPVPVGTIIQSALSQAELNELDGAGVWQLCDGRNVPGSKYAEITKRTTVPDLRGSFLRGAGTRTGVTGWVGGTVNTHVEDSTRAPRTDFTVTSRDPIRNNGNSRGISGSASYGSGEAYLYPGLNTNRVDGGDAETRPKHYVVNYFIRVN